MSPAQVMTACGALAFLFIQIMILEIRSGNTERARLTERLAALEASLSGLSTEVKQLERRFGMMADLVVEHTFPRIYSENTPPPPEL